MLEADVADCDKDCDMGTEDCGDLAEDAAVEFWEKPPFESEFIEE